MNNNIIEVKNLSYTYPGYDDRESKKAIDDISFEIEKGSFVAILGHNGSGKSTLASLLCMLLEADSGSIIINGRDMCADDITDYDILKARKSVGMVFQNPDNQIVATIVEEDVAFGCENIGMPQKQIRENVDEALKIVGMTEYARHAPHKLSGGQKQRVAIAGAIAMDREVLIFDESTSMLDPSGRRDVMNTIRSLNRDKNMTIVIITHFMEEATQADKIIVLESGKIIASGTPRDVFSRPEPLWNAGLDVPQSTELLYMLKKDGFEVSLDRFSPSGCADEIAKAAGVMK